MKLYDAKNYRAGAQRLERAMQEKDHTAKAAYYAGICHQLSGNRGRAMVLLKYVADNFASTEEGKASIAAVNLLNKTEAMGTPLGTLVIIGGGGAGSTKKQSFGSRDTGGLIEVIKPHDNREPVTGSFVEDATQQVKTLPLPLLHLLRNKGLKVALTPTAVDFNPALLQEHPRGYEHGKTFRDVPAFYSPTAGRLVVAQYVFSEGEAGVRPTDDPYGAMWHELGHAVDHAMGDLSRDPEYMRIWLKDLDRLDPGVRSDLKYFTAAPGGPSETFAEMFAGLYGSRSTSWRQNQNARVYDAFMEVSSFIKYKISQLR